MNIRTRKFIGTLLTVGFVLIYSLVLMAFGGVFIVGKGALIQLAFYIIAGFAWMPPVMWIIRWMSKPDEA